MRALLDTTYALMVAETESAGAARPDAIAALERILAEPLPDEVSAEALELARRKRIAEENARAIERMAGLSGMGASRGV